MGSYHRGRRDTLDLWQHTHSTHWLQGCNYTSTEESTLRSLSTSSLSPLFGLLISNEIGSRERNENNTCSRRWTPSRARSNNTLSIIFCWPVSDTNTLSLCFPKLISTLGQEPTHTHTIVRCARGKWKRVWIVGRRHTHTHTPRYCLDCATLGSSVVGSIGTTDYCSLTALLKWAPLGNANTHGHYNNFLNWLWTCW